jgi:hypothetical protein
MSHTIEKFLMKLQLCLKPHLNQRFAQEVMGPQSNKRPNFGKFRTPNLGVLRQNDIWVQAPWPCTKNSIRGRWWLPPSLSHGESYECVFACGLSVHQKCSNYALTNLFFGLCRSMWIIDLLVTFPNPHPGASARPSTPKVLWTKECAPIPYPFVVFKEFGGVSLDFTILDDDLIIFHFIEKCPCAMFGFQLGNVHISKDNAFDDNNDITISIY